MTFARSVLFFTWIVSPALVYGCDGTFRFDEPPADGGFPDGAPVPTTSPGSCSKEAECGLPSLHCDIPTARCAACTEDVHCGGATPRCDPALRRCVQCSSTDDCASPLTCDPSTRACLAGCREERDPCPSGTRCSEKLRRCTACYENEHCKAFGTAFVCDVKTGRCIECARDADCSSGHCDTFIGRCVACLSAADCGGDTPLCNIAKGNCEARL